MFVRALSYCKRLCIVLGYQVRLRCCKINARLVFASCKTMGYATLDVATGRVEEACEFLCISKNLWGIYLDASFIFVDVCGLFE